MKIRNIVLISSSISLAVAGFIGLAIGSINPKVVNAAVPDKIISNSSEFVEFRNDVNTGTSYDDQLIRLDADVEITLTSKPSADAADGYCTFKGTFDGNGHTIDITIDTADSAVGLFRNQNGTFKNVTLTGEIKNSGTYASPLAVYNNGTIQDVHSSITANLPTIDYVSGIVFRNQSSGRFIDCEFSGNIVGKNYVGGIVSDNIRYIGGCVNSGSVSGTSIVGGIAATSDKGNTLSSFTYLRMVDCVNNGTCSGQYAGGIIGQLTRGSVTNCNNISNFTSSSDYVGGIAGSVDNDGIISQCTNSGAISAPDRIGGIAGLYKLGSISNCLNEGTVSATTGAYCGGIASIMGNVASGVGNDVTLSNCVNKGLINGVADVGGILGFAYSNSKIIYCSNYANVTSTKAADGIGTGGIVGRFNQTANNEGARNLVQYCYNGGIISANRLVGGIIGTISSNTSPAVEVLNSFTTGNVIATISSGNANAGTLVGFSNTGKITVNDSWAVSSYQVTSGATANTYGYGIGGGTARSDASSKAEGVSDAFREVVQFIREYNCEEDVSSFKTKYKGLSDDEKSLLNEVNYYDENTSFIQRTYKSAAEYIIGNDDSGSLLGIKVFADSEESKLFIIITVFALISLTTTIGFVVLKSKKAR